MSIDYERLMQVTPTHVLVQPPAGGVDPGLIKTAASTGITICSWPINTAADLLTLLGELPECLGLATTVTSRCQELAPVMDRPPGPGRLIGPVLIVSPGPTPLAHGGASYLGELLSRHGGVNAIAAAAWKQLSIEDIVTIDPGTIIIVSEAGSGDRAAIVAEMGGDRTRAGTAGRIAFLIHPDALRPSSSLKDVATELYDHLDTLRVEVPR
jgi:ABC-type hemin transport system substrate-binding protein